MSKLKGKNKKFGRCHVHGQGCEVCSEIRSGYVNRKTDVSIHMGFERKLLDDPNFSDKWIEDQMEDAKSYFFGKIYE